MAHTEHYQQTIVDIHCQVLSHLDSVSRLPVQLGIWYERTKQRRRLSGLSSELLQDIGLTKDDVKNECRKFFWQP